MRVRRLGSRVATRFSVFVGQGAERLRGRAAELSTTGVLLDLRHAERRLLLGMQQLELAVPGVPRPIRVVARPVREVGRLRAFEFLSIDPVDRLTLAEYIDKLGRPGWR
jgi:PilZ domain